MKKILLWTILSSLLAIGISPTRAVGASQNDSPPKNLTATQTDTPPVIDGKLDDACWAKAAKTGLFTRYTQSESVPPEQTSGQVCFDSENIYVAVQCQVTDMDHFRSRLADIGKTFAWKKCGNIQVFFDPGNLGRNRHQFCLHPNGSVMAHIPHRRGTKIEPALPQDVTFKTSLTETGYVMEAAFPFYMFALQKESSPVWGFNLAREHDTSGQYTASGETYSCWNFTQQHGFIDPEHMGTLTMDTDLSPFYLTTKIDQMPRPNDATLAVYVANKTEMDLSGDVTVNAIFSDGKTQTYTKPVSIKADQEKNIILDQSDSPVKTARTYEAIVTNTSGQAVSFVRQQSFYAEAIIKDLPFKSRQLYLDKYPQYCVQEKDLIYNNRLYLSPDRVLPRGITYAHSEKSNLLYCSEQDIRFCFEFPQGTEVTGMCMGNTEDARGHVFPTIEPFTREGEQWNRYELKLQYIQDRHHSEGIHHVYCKTNLPIGQTAKAYYYLTWKNGRQPAQEIQVESIRVPRVKPPRNIYVGIWGLGPGRLKMLCPNFPEDFTSLGLNTIGLTYYGHIDEDSDDIQSYYEFGEPTYQAAREHGLYVLYNSFKPHTPKVQYGHPAYWAARDESARAKNINGQTLPWGAAYVVCPSYRGQYYKEALQLLTTHEQLKRWPASLFNMDIEMYGGRGTQVCFCERCIRLHKDWFSKNYPYLEYIDPVSLNREVKRSENIYTEEATVTTKYPGQYYAWTQFKIEQFSDMIEGIHDTLSDVIGNVRTAPFDDIVFAEWGAIYPDTLQQEGAMYGPYTNDNSISIWAVGAYGPAGLLADPQHSGKLDKYYMTALGKRVQFYDTAPSSLYEPGQSHGFATKPERSKYYLLETVMSGATGILIYYFSGVEGKQLAINAEVFGSFRLIDDLTTKGKRMTNLTVEGKDMHARGFQVGNERVVLVGDHYVATDSQQAILTCPVEKKVDVYDLLKRKKLGELSPQNPRINLVIKDLDDRARFLYIGNNWKKRSTW